MNDMPNRISAKDGYDKENEWGKWYSFDVHRGTTYIRADLAPQWQPIETAPRDGTHILAHVSYKRNVANIREVWWEPDCFEDEWGVTTGGWADDFGWLYVLTHWMPLPEPPK